MRCRRYAALVSAIAGRIFPAMQARYGLPAGVEFKFRDLFLVKYEAAPAEVAAEMAAAAAMDAAMEEGEGPEVAEPLQNDLALHCDGMSQPSWRVADSASIAGTEPRASQLAADTCCQGSLGVHG